MNTTTNIGIIIPANSIPVMVSDNAFRKAVKCNIVANIINFFLLLIIFFEKVINILLLISLIIVMV